jgi:hypothetical protein
MPRTRKKATRQSSPASSDDDPQLRPEELKLTLKQLKQLFRLNDIPCTKSAPLKKAHAILASRSLEERVRIIPTSGPAPLREQSEITSQASAHTGLTARISRAFDKDIDDVTHRNIGAELNLEFSTIKKAYK